MNQAFDPFNLILLAIAVVVIFRLRSVLGTRTGHERRYDPFSPSPNSETEKQQDDNVIPAAGSMKKNSGIMIPTKRPSQSGPDTPRRARILPLVWKRSPKPIGTLIRTISLLAPVLHMK